MARPSKLNEELINRFYEELSEGLPVRYCCGLLGITEAIFSIWMRDGEDDFVNERETLKSEFFKTIKKAQAEYVREAHKRIKKGEQGWQGQAWWLERTRQDFMPKYESQDIGKEKVVVKFDVPKSKKEK